MIESQWIDAHGATLGKLLEHGGVWVVEKLPPNTGRLVQQWEAVVTDRKIDMIKLIRQWAFNIGIRDLPRTHQDAMYRFSEAIRSNVNVALILKEAHVARPSTLAATYRLAELGALVVLVGDVAVIRAGTDRFPSFRQRASYAISVNRLFS